MVSTSLIQNNFLCRNDSELHNKDQKQNKWATTDCLENQQNDAMYAWWKKRGAISATATRPLTHVHITRDAIPDGSRRSNGRTLVRGKSRARHMVVALTEHKQQSLA